MCKCSDVQCQGSLGFHRGQDPALYDLYARKLPKAGWSGLKTPEELAFKQTKRPPTEKQKAAGQRLRPKQTPML